MTKEPQVAVILGSESDRPIADKTAGVLNEFGIAHEVKILSAHRSPKELERYVQECKAKVFIGIAGLAAHLPGFLASHTNKPVIGVPVNAQLGGLDSLLSIVQMPKGVPVACVAIDNGENAARLAARILALTDSSIEKKLEGHHQ